MIRKVKDIVSQYLINNVVAFAIHGEGDWLIKTRVKSFS